MTAPTTPLGPFTPLARRTPRPPVRRHRAGALLTVALAAAVVTVAPVGTTALARRSAAPLTSADVARLSATAQAALLQPLRTLAQDLDGTGRSAVWRATYSGVDIDASADRVELYVTARAAGRRLLARARDAAPHAQWSRVRITKARYSKVILDRAAQRIVERDGDTVQAVSVPADGSALDVRPTTAGASAKTVAGALGVRVVLSAPVATVAKSWADVKWHDSAPFIGGDTLTATGSGICTAGLPAVQRSTGKQVMITAAHCFSNGERVYTGGGTTGKIGNGKTGSYVGTVIARTTEWDADELSGTSNNADESDTYGWKPLTSVAYSYDGDYVCQDGAASYFLGHPTPCGIKVTDDDIWFSIDGYMARGVEGIDERTGWGSHNGDSGGTVFAVEPDNNRQARGIVSSGGLDGTSDQRRVDWTEAVDIFRTYGLELNPQT